MEELLERTTEGVLKTLMREDGSGAPGVMLKGVASTFCTSEMKLVSKLSNALLRLEGRMVSHD